jgi:hypothetical protein
MDEKIVSNQAEDKGALELKASLELSLFIFDSLVAQIRQYQKYVVLSVDDYSRSENMIKIAELKGDLETLSTQIFLLSEHYILDQDKLEFEEKLKNIGAFCDPSNFEELFEVTRFVNRVLKNSDLVEMRKKPRFDYIEAGC